ncbi:2,3-bisphosphoglycerate-independent phosphoglycerate mutase [Pseudomonas lalucatii]|uniref:2,3-bisphosphoglycerate-independent phosphoglycerate mutase n=2 Tax=Pseudomonas lalucatii TaxID=1424203 RepID=A0ABS5Q6N7_9PSED|nr:2,3-bisphosphoglycerate-independent phosphoglycerate mutase [Pseudomonas lalucatii]
MTPKNPLALLILDGWGHSDDPAGNAIHRAHTPVWDQLLATCPHSRIATSGLAVGLPDGQMGNSEVGHMNLGAGRIVYQSLTRVDKAIEDGSFYSNPALVGAVDRAVSRNKAVHILGLLSPGGVHSHQAQIEAACALAARRGAARIFVHAFLDGRDTPPRSALASLTALNRQLEALGVGRIASLIGRYYAMDRDQRWDRIEQAYRLITEQLAAHRYPTAEHGLEAAYARGESDEFVQATLIAEDGSPGSKVEAGDALIFMNFRPDRSRQLSRCFCDAAFDAFERPLVLPPQDFVTLTRYAEDLDAACAFPPESLNNCLGDWLALHEKTQLRLAETEKYAHVTFFFNGGVEQPAKGEARILVPSPSVATYDLKPEMSAPEVTDHLVSAIEQGEYDLIVCNFANADMVGHTGDFDAAVKAVETLDQCLGRVLDALSARGGECLITADHGNVEQMADPNSGQAHTAHTTLPVPLVYVGPQQGRLALANGALCDIAPTLLELMGMAAPSEMSGKSLLIRESPNK